MDDKIVVTFCLCDDLLKAIHHQEDRQCQMNDAEIMTTAVIVDCRIIFRFQTHKISRFLTLWDIKTGTFRHISFPCLP